MKFKKRVLKNGLTILHEKRDVPVTTVMLAVKYGAAYESKEDKGISHFIEHLCFKGTEKRSVNQISEEIEGKGGILNAFTSEEITAYYSKLPSKYLETAIDVISDIFFNASFPEGEIAKEGNAIIEEIKMYHDDPRGHVLTQIKGNLYEGSFGMPILGTVDNIKGMTRERLFERHRKVYTPQNSILCVVGNNDFEEVVSLSEKFVSKSFEKPLPLSIEKIKPILVKGEEKRNGLHQANLALGFHFPSMTDNKRYASEIFSTILGRGMSSKLFREVREKRGLVYGIKTEVEAGKDFGSLIIWAGTDPSNKEKVIDICLKEYSKMKDISLGELESAKEKLIGNRQVEVEDSESAAIYLILEEIYGKAEDYYKYEEEVKKVSLEDIKELSKKKDFASFVLGP